MPRLLLFIVTLAALLTAAHTQPAAAIYPDCDHTFSCGSITNATFPFTGGDRPSHCGPPEFALTCRDGAIAELTHDSLDYRVLELNQSQQTLVLSRSDLYNDTCTSELRNTTFNNTFFTSDNSQNEALTLFYGCNEPGITLSPHNRCSSSGLNFTDAYYLVGPVPRDPILRILYCEATVDVPVLMGAGNRLAASEISLGDALREGFLVNYSVESFLCPQSQCNAFGGHCGFDPVLGQPICICPDDRPCPFPLNPPPQLDAPSPPSAERNRSTTARDVGIVLGVTGAAVLIIISIVCCVRRIHSHNQERYFNVEKFLLQHGPAAPKRYKYSEIKRMTNSLRDKLGQGGYGSVYKGKLPDGSLVAVKILTVTNSIGEDFINEVASISKTSHVNIVNLLGFCYDTKRTALLYEYMPNKSLDMYIGNSAGSVNLESEMLYKIAAGVARGLEYLHRGCNTRIVHFDIKPQNILLDNDFCPKISDFGLAKLCKKDQSLMSMMGTRGTAGYIAPEVFSRNFGGVSHKSDVYSYGMMVLEMAGANTIAHKTHETTQSSEDYFPDKIYERVLNMTRKLDGFTIEEERETTRKMLLVGFWCIQTNPSERPSISKVVEMLEGTLESIQIPPKPVFFSPTLPVCVVISSSFSSYVETEPSLICN